MTTNEIDRLISVLKGRLALCQTSNPAKAQSLAQEISALISLRDRLTDEETQAS